MDAKLNTLAVLSPEVKEVVLASPFLALVSVSGQGEPHLIVVGKVKQITNEGQLVFGVYKMEKTQQNLLETGCLQAVAVAGQQGYRFTGKAIVQNGELIFTIQTTTALL